MTLTVIVEPNRLLATTLDLDGNVEYYDLNSQIFQAGRGVPLTLFSEGYSVYIGRQARLIQKADPFLPILNWTINSSEILSSEPPYIDQSKRQWTAEMLFAVFTRFIVDKIEISQTKTVSEVQWCVNGILLTEDYKRLFLKSLELLKLKQSTIVPSWNAIGAHHKLSSNSSQEIFHFGVFKNTMTIEKVVFDHEDCSLVSEAVHQTDLYTRVYEYLVIELHLQYQMAYDKAILDSKKNSVVIEQALTTLITKYSKNNTKLLECYLAIDNEAFIISFDKAKIDRIVDEVIEEATSNLKDADAASTDEEPCIIYTTGFWEQCEKVRSSINRTTGLEVSPIPNLHESFCVMNGLSAIKKLSLDSFQVVRKSPVVEVKPVKIKVEKKQRKYSLFVKHNSTIQAFDISEDKRVIFEAGQLEQESFALEELEITLVKLVNHVPQTLGHLKIGGADNLKIAGFEIFMQIQNEDNFRFSGLDRHENMPYTIDFIPLIKNVRTEPRKNLNISDNKKPKIKINKVRTVHSKGKKSVLNIKAKKINKEKIHQFDDFKTVLPILVIS